MTAKFALVLEGLLSVRELFRGGFRCNRKPKKYLRLQYCIPYSCSASVGTIPAEPNLFGIKTSLFISAETEDLPSYSNDGRNRTCIYTHIHTHIDAGNSVTKITKTKPGTVYFYVSQAFLKAFIEGHFFIYLHSVQTSNFRTWHLTKEIQVLNLRSVTRDSSSYTPKLLAL